MARSRSRMTGRADRARFVGLPVHVVDSGAWRTLPPWVRALYVDLRRQFNGFNNGDIAATDSLLRPMGWAHSTIHKGLRRLMDHGLIEQTRQGGIASMSRVCSLYAFTDLPVAANERKGIKGAQPSHAYRGFRPKHEPSSAATDMRRHKVNGAATDNAKVHRVDLNVHPVNLQRSTA